MKTPLHLQQLYDIPELLTGRKLWRAWLSHHGPRKKENLFTWWLLEATGGLPQIGDSGNVRKHVGQKELALIAGVQRETITKRISRLAPQDPEWWSDGPFCFVAGPKRGQTSDALCQCRSCRQLQAQGLARKSPRQCQSDKISAIAANHPHWKREQSAVSTQHSAPAAWEQTKDGDPRVKAIFDRHYSRRRYKDGREPKLFVGPGEKMVLISPDQKAIFIWRKFISNDGQKGINCAVFRNEGDQLSSDLILQAEDLALKRWPASRFYTYVDAQKIESSNPGYCFKVAGWTPCGTSKDRGLLILEKFSQHSALAADDEGVRPNHLGVSNPTPSDVPPGEGAASDGAGKGHSHNRAILARHRHFTVPNLYSLACDDGKRPGIGAGANHVGFLAHTFGADMFSREAQLKRRSDGLMYGWLEASQSLEGYRKTYGWIWHKNLPDAPDCTCVLQMKLKFSKEDAGGRAIHDASDAGDLRATKSKLEAVGGNTDQPIHDADSGSNGASAVQRSGQKSEGHPERETSSQSGVVDAECPKCGGAGYTITGVMPDYGRLLLHFLLDRGIDEEIRRCEKCKRNFAGQQMCPGCGARGEVFKKRSELHGYTQQMIAEATGMDVSTVRRYFRIFKRLNLVRTAKGQVWWQCLKCQGPLYFGKNECPKCKGVGEAKGSDPQIIIWVTSRTLDKELAATERARLAAVVKFHRRWLDQKHQAQLEQAVELAEKVLGEWEGKEHLLVSFWSEMRRRLEHSTLRANLVNVLFPLQRE